MHLLPHSLAIYCLLSLAYPEALAAPHSTPRSPIPRTIPLLRRSRTARNATETIAWLQHHRDSLVGKYGGKAGSGNAKRASGVNLLTNQQFDSSYYGSIAVGTPAVAFDVILDTGSSDLWVAAADGLSTVDDGITKFDPSASSTFKDLNTPFEIQYGSGAAQGTLGQDVVQMAGFQVDSQMFGVVTQQQGVLNAPVSGLMGLAFQTIASSGATPFWEALANSDGTLDEPLMAFQFTRYLDVAQAEELEPGGTFNLGAVNTSLFTGDIDYQPIPDGQEGFWIQELTGLTVNGNSITLPSGSGSYAAIDTGTTLVTGPEDVVAALYAQIPGSEALSGQNEGFYQYPCDTEVNITMRFGASTVSWPISPVDIPVSTGLSRGQCVGAFNSINLGGSGSGVPAWIVGDTFLKNVYSVFRAQPASVGFAALSDAATAQNGDLEAPVAEPTIGSVVTVSAASTGVSPAATDRAASEPNGAAPRGAAGFGMSFVVGALVGAALL